jgi:hypothetical protein
LVSLSKKVCKMCEEQPLLTVGTPLSKMWFHLQNGVHCQASKSNGDLWSSLSTIGPLQGGVVQNNAFDQWVWLFRFKGERFEIFVEGKIHCPLCFIKKLIATGPSQLNELTNRIWVFNEHVFDQDSKEEKLFETALQNNCPPKVAILLK